MDAWESYLIAGGAMLGLAVNEWRWRRRDQQLRHNLRLCIAAYVKLEGGFKQYRQTMKERLDDQIARSQEKRI